MRIGVNGRFLVAKRTGVQRMAYNLLKILVEIDRDNEYVIFTGYEELNNSDWKKPNVRVVPFRLRERESFWNHFWEQFILPIAAKRQRVDLLHSPANLAPLFYKGKSVINIHDLCFVVNPQWYSFWFRTMYNAVIPKLARKASKVITNSNNSRNDLIQYFGLSVEDVSLIYWATDEAFREDSSPLEPVPEKDYILYVGSLEPRKNFMNLVDAYMALRRRHPSMTTKLILIGGESPLFAEVRVSVREFKDDIVFKGFVDDRQLRAYYTNARLFAYPSLYEGFGLPPLEAMALGTPVVTSSTSSIPEVAGDAALQVNPTDVEAISAAIEKVLLDPELREELIRKGYEKVEHFSWHKVARRTLAVYQEVHHKQNKKSPSQRFSFDNWRKLKEIEGTIANQSNH